MKKTKMKHKKILNLKKDFSFFVFDQIFFSLRFSILLFSLSIFSVCSKKIFLKLSWCRLCEIFFRLFSRLSNLIVRCRNFSKRYSNAIRNRSVVKNVSNFWLKILFLNAFSTWIVSCAIVANVSMSRAWQ
jgi:hypothetical protein